MPFFSMEPPARLSGLFVGNLCCFVRIFQNVGIKVLVHLVLFRCGRISSTGPEHGTFWGHEFGIRGLWTVRAGKVEAPST